jgi:CHAT domain
MANTTTTGEALRPRSKRQGERKHLEIIIYSDPVLMVMVGGEPPYLPTFALGDLTARNLEFVDILESLRLQVQDRGIDLTGYDHDYLDQLRAAGLSAYNKLIADQFRGALQRASEDGQKELSLTFRTPPQMSFLWELIYDGKPAGPARPESFWGFRYPIGRAFMLEKIQHPTEIRPWHGIFSAIHEDLPFSKPEVERLKGYLERAKKEYHLPELRLQLLDDEFPNPPLASDQLMERFISEDFDYGIIHFACHCENPEEGGAHQASLILKAHGQEFKMRLQTLELWLGEGKGDGSFSNRPFVFINACESQTIGHLLESSNFPEGFLRFRASGVIATACTVPDRFANAFATEFYRQLLKLGEEKDPEQKEPDTAEPARETEDQGHQPLDTTSSIGEALLKTRLHFLVKYNNPLGLAYGLYALSNQRLRLED